MKASRITAAIIILIGLAFCFGRLSAAGAPGKGQRGDTPYCQEDCLRRHSDKMKQLSEEYRKTQNWMAYQEGVEKEIRDYSSCLTDCRELMPVK
jgi:hypothetical protein